MAINTGISEVDDAAAQDIAMDASKGDLTKMAEACKAAGKMPSLGPVTHSADHPATLFHSSGDPLCDAVSSEVQRRNSHGHSR